MKSLVASLATVVVFLGSCVPCSGQVTYHKEYKPYEPIIIKLDGQVQPEVKRTVLWDANFSFVDTPGVLYGWAAPGSYKFTGTVFNTKKVKIETVEYDVLVGVPTVIRGEFRVTGSGPTPPPPEPGPGPNPVPPPTPGNCDAVPGDIFDNLGKRSCGWASGLTKRKEVALIYEKYAGRLLKDPSTTINSVSLELVTERETLLGPDVTFYKPFLDKTQEELNRRWPMSKGTMANFYMAIGAGLKNEN